MTISTTNSYLYFDGNGSNKNFPFNMRFFSDPQIIVVKITADDVTTTLSLGTDYSLTGAGTETGGTVTTTVAPLTGEKLLVRRLLPYTQQTSLRNQGAFYPAIHEDAFDYLTMLVQQTQDTAQQSIQLDDARTAWDAQLKKISNLAPGVAPSDAVTVQQIIDMISAVTGDVVNTDSIYYHGVSLTTFLGSVLTSTSTIPATQVGIGGTNLGALVLANNLFVVDTVADLLAFDISVGTRVRTLGYYAKGDGGAGVYFVDAADTTSASNGGTILVAGTTRWKLVQDGSVSVLQFGARGNGTTDDTAAIQNAVNACGRVRIPYGRKCKINSINLPAHVTLSGDTPINAGSFYDLNKCSWLHCVSTSAPAIVLNSGAVLENLSFFYPNQQTNAAPTVYPATVQLGEYSGDNMIRNCYFMNSYVAIDASTPVGQHTSLWVSDVIGYPLYRGIILNNGIDVDRLTRVMFSRKYYPQSGTVLQQWVQSNATAFVIYRADTGIAENCFVFGYYGGCVNDGTNVFTWIGCAWDECQSPIQVIGNSTGIRHIDSGIVARNGLNLTNACDGMLINSPTADVLVSNCRFWGITGHGMYVNQCASIQIIGNKFYDFGSAATGAAQKGAIHIPGSAALNVMIANNDINGNASANCYGVYMYAAGGGVYIDGNSIHNFSAAPAINVAAGGGNFTIRNNVFRAIGGGSGGIIDGSGSSSKVITNNLVF